ncbi:MAG: TonB-dependent receptor [Acidobacteria bacterium]|nr:TonB-dependent receptor [Acidobacteriota bacterium]
MRRVKVWSSILAAMLLFSSAGWAQVATGTISGAVSDSTGAVVPGAQVTVKNVGTGQLRELTTNERGRYTAPQLSVGSYEITVSSQGFQTEARSGITLSVGQEAVVNFSLQVGAVTERIEVTGEASLVETTTATTSGLVDEKTVRDLPLNGRSFTDLMDLQPNVKKVLVGGSSRSSGFGIKFSVAGSHPNQNNYMLDGLNMNDSRVQTPASAGGGILGTDTIQEFRMLTSNYSAEFGQVGGGVMVAVTKQGSNSINGSVFEYLRNSALDARRFFDAGGVPPFKRNQFGFTLGGPVKKDRTFFYGSYEGLRERLSDTSISVVPTADARRGFLPSGPCVNGCAVGSTAQKILNLFPLPNSTNHGNGTADYNTALANPTDEDYLTIRLDHNFSSNHMLFGRYTFDDGTEDSESANGLNTSGNVSRSHQVALSFTSVLTPTLLNNVRVGVNRSVAELVFASTGKDLSPFIHIPGREAGNVSITTCCGIGGGDPSSGYWWTSYQVSDDVTATRGNHSLKFGWSLNRNWANQSRPWGPENGNYDFATLEDFYAQRPNNLLMGGPATDTIRAWRQWYHGLYAQDDWKLMSNLTLNLGLRFDWFTVPTEANNKIAQPRDIIRDQSTIVGGPFWEQRSAFAHFSPRVGIAWDPFGNGKTSIRTGFGVFQQAIRTLDYTHAGDRNPPTSGFFLVQPTTGNPLTYPDAWANLGRAALSGAAQPRIEANAFEMEQPYKLNWNFSIQQEVLPNTKVDIGYVGSRSVHQLRATSDANSPANIAGPDGRRYIPLTSTRPNTKFSQIRYRDAGNDAYYNSLQIGVQKRFTSGFQVNSSYTWSKSIDTSSITFSQGTEFSGNSVQEPFPDKKNNRGPSSWDIANYWSTNFLVDLPFGPGKPLGENLTGVGAKILGGWSLSSVITVQSGTPFSPILASDYAAALPQGGGGGQKPDLAVGAKQNTVLSNWTPTLYFDVNAYELPPLTPDCVPLTTGGANRCTRRVFGNVGRNILRGPGIVTVDFSFLKRTQITEGSELQFRAEFFNMLNRANFAIPDGRVFTSTSRPVRDVRGGRITNVLTTGRQIQFALKFIF